MHGSISISTSHELETGQNEDLHVEPEAPIPDVPKVAIDPPFHHLDARRLAAEAIHLRPSGEARFDMLAKCVIGDELHISIIVSNRVRSRTDQGHVPAEHIDELWQLVDAGGS
jgi:hypothetical protein